mmetsp:Transcript_54344/g.129495  ORF Transcript_54344/g.129495 Transcript_54344/m.129495 type:complete len:277 (+) Transcript_54344:487-1317(+)
MDLAVGGSNCHHLFLGIIFLHLHFHLLHRSNRSSWCFRTCFLLALAAMSARVLLACDAAVCLMPGHLKAATTRARLRFGGALLGVGDLCLCRLLWLRWCQCSLQIAGLHEMKLPIWALHHDHLALSLLHEFEGLRHARLLIFRVQWHADLHLGLRADSSVGGGAHCHRHSLASSLRLRARSGVRGGRRLDSAGRTPGLRLGAGRRMGGCADFNRHRLASALRLGARSSVCGGRHLHRLLGPGGGLRLCACRRVCGCAGVGGAAPVRGRRGVSGSVR